MTTPINDGGPAFPVPEGNGCGPWGGTTLRDWFAGQVVQGLLACPRYYYTSNGAPLIAADAYALADAMLAARGAKQ